MSAMGRAVKYIGTLLGIDFYEDSSGRHYGTLDRIQDPRSSVVGSRDKKTEPVLTRGKGSLR